MISKKYITLIIFLLVACGFINGLQAQDKVNSVVQNITVQASVNLSYPIINSLRKEPLDSFALGSPNVYLEFGYKKWHLRAGAGGRITHQNNRSDLANNVSDIRRYKYSFTGSILHRSDVNEKINFYAGVYFWNLYFLDETTYDSGFDLSTKYNEMIGYAGGPGVKFEYKLANRVSLFTEYCALFRLDHRYSGRTFSAFPSESYKVHASTLNSIVFEHPISIFLSYKF